MRIAGSKAILSFDHIAGGLKSRDNAPLAGFAIGGADGKFVPATAQIDGDTVVVSASTIPAPTTVRYGWADNPQEANLINGAGLPAPPFRTDSPK